jgi:uncharacterized protein (TIGR02145 family)
MKTFLILILFASIGLKSLYAQVGIGTTSPDPSSVLDVDVSTLPSNAKKGFLPPRMDTTARDAIVGPTEGLTIYNTTVKCLQWYVGGNAWHNACGGNTYLDYPPGTVFCEEGPTEIIVVTSTTGRDWMDRNLGASQAATAINDPDAFGSLYQWGRAADGHQCRTSPTSTTAATTTAPMQGNVWDGAFIRSGNTWLDSSINSTTLWQGVDGINNPCPSGFRLPTIAEWNTEIDEWATGTANTNDAYNSNLAITEAGFRLTSSGNVDSGLGYWSQDDDGNGRAKYMRATVGGTIDTSDTDPIGPGLSVRCIKD